MSSAANLSPNELFAPPRGVRCRELLRLDEFESTQHIVQFYEDESLVIENISYLAAKAMAAGNSTVLVATETHLELINEQLARFGLNLDALRESGRYVTLNAAEALSQIVVDSKPDKAKFADVIGGIVASAAKNSANDFVFVFGEMVALLCAADNADAAVRLERLWNSLAEQHRFSLYCAYFPEQPW